MGLISSVGSKAMRPPIPATYDISPTGKFTDGWLPHEHFEERCGCPIVLSWSDSLRKFSDRKEKAALLDFELLRRETNAKEEIAILRVFWRKKIDEQKRPTLIYSKGNSFDLGILRFHCLQLAMILECDVIAYDYTGYGISKVSPNVMSTLSDAETVFQYAKSVSQNLILYGFSLGNGPTLHLAAKYTDEIKGIILRSPFVSGVAAATDIAQRHFAAWIPKGALPSFFDVWPCAQLIKRVKVPTLIIHGDKDELIRPWQPRQLLANCPSAVEPFFMPNLGHFDIERHPEYVARLSQFIHSEVVSSSQFTINGQQSVVEEGLSKR